VDCGQTAEAMGYRDTPSPFGRRPTPDGFRHAVTERGQRSADRDLPETSAAIAVSRANSAPPASTAGGIGRQVAFVSPPERRHPMKRQLSSPLKPSGSLLPAGLWQRSMSRSHSVLPSHRRALRLDEGIGGSRVVGRASAIYLSSDIKSLVDRDTQ